MNQQPEVNRRKVAVVLVDRANYGRLMPVMAAIRSRPELELLTVVGGSMVLERFSQPYRVVVADGFPIAAQVYLELEGSNPMTMAKSIGLGIIEFSSVFQRLSPDVIVIIGDRYEALAAAVAGAYLNKCVVHLQGGEISGSIDDSGRHAISKLAHFHVPATQQAKSILMAMGEAEDTILSVGCPSSDIARSLDRRLSPDVINRSGSGDAIDVSQPYLLTVFHPTTTEYGDEESQIGELISALKRLSMPTVLMWPNIDAGAGRVTKVLRTFRAEPHTFPLRTLVNLPPDDYLRLLANAGCAVGNSSSFVRDAGYFGTPVVIVGSRQDGRECDVHVTRVPCVAENIVTAVCRQVQAGSYEPSQLYGDGYVGERVAASLVSLTPYVQKRPCFDLTPRPTSNPSVAAARAA